jgi:hypothetical protein
VKDENGDLLADSHNIFNRWKNYFSQLLDVHNVSDVRQIGVRRAEPLVPGSSRLEVEIAIAKLKKYKSPGSNEIPAELIQAGGEISEQQLFVDFKKAYDSVRREVLYNILIEFEVPMKLVRLIKICLNMTYSKVRIGKHLSESFPIQNGLKQGDASGFPPKTYTRSSFPLSCYMLRPSHPLLLDLMS